ncbi:MAG: hypothetical protein FJ315_00925 [SAR202 cluster bacterium]|nr:hypothetical protein [SAR202 cluster bacterium]
MTQPSNAAVTLGRIEGASAGRLVVTYPGAGRVEERAIFAVSDDFLRAWSGKDAYIRKVNGFVAKVFQQGPDGKVTAEFPGQSRELVL